MTTVSGFVRDTQQNAIPNAIVTVRYLKPVIGFDGGAAVQNVRTFTADGTGFVTMPDLVPGSYEATFYIAANANTSQQLLQVVTLNVLAQDIQTLESAIAATVGDVTPTVLQQAVNAKDQAEAFANALSRFTAREAFTFTTNGTLGPYALAFNPQGQTVALSISGATQFQGRDFTVVSMPSAPSGVGITFSDTFLPAGLIVDYWIDRPVPYDPASEVLHVEEFGATGTGTGNDGPAILAALTVANGRKVVGRPGATYRITTASDYTGPFDLDLSGSTVDLAANVPFLTMRAPVVGPALLTADYVPGALAVACAALSEVPAPGDSLVIWSRALDPANRGNGASANKYRVAEVVEVGIGSTTTNVVLSRPLRFTRGCDPTQTSAPRTDVDAYTVAQGARIGIVKRVKAKLRLGEMAYTDGQDATWNAHAISVFGYIGLDSVGGSLLRGYNNGLRLIGTRGHRVSGFHASNLQSNPGNGQFGYGVASNGTDGVVLGLTGANTRHLFTTNAIAQGEAPITVYDLLLSARCRNEKVIAGVGYGGSTAPWDTHHCATDVTFVDCTSVNPVGVGFGLRGQNVTAIAPKVIGGLGSGISVFTDFSNGDGDPWVNGRRMEDFTSATIIDPQIDCANRKIVSARARAWVSGKQQFSGASHAWYQAEGGVIYVSDFARGAATGAGDNLVGVLRAESAVPWTSGSETVPAIYVDGVIDIDASASTATNTHAAQALDSGVIRNRGTVRAALPAGSSVVASTVDAAISCDARGRFDYTIPGDTTIIDGLGTRPVRVVNLASGRVFDGVPQSLWNGYTEQVALSPGRMTVSFGSNGNNGITLRNVDSQVSTNEFLGGITFITTDDDNPETAAARILFRGSSPQGWVDTFFQRNAGTGLLDALKIGRFGEVDFFSEDGVTVGLRWSGGARVLRHTPRTVASLPSAATAGSGSRTFVSDANSPVFGSVVAGGGAVPVPVYSDGTNWRVG